MALVKDVYNLRFYNQLTDILQAVFPLFEKENFIKDIFSAGFDNMEYRSKHPHHGVRRLSSEGIALIIKYSFLKLSTYTDKPGQPIIT